MGNVAEDRLKLHEQAEAFINNPFFIHSVLPDHMRNCIARMEAEKYRLSFILVHEVQDENIYEMLENINDQIRKVLGL